VTNGTAVLGLGNIGPLAGLPAKGDELVPDPLDKSVHERVTAAVRDAAAEAEMVF
jgi:malic enzyme